MMDCEKNNSIKNKGTVSKASVSESYLQRRSRLEKERDALIFERERLIRERDHIIQNIDAYLEEMNAEIMRLGGVVPESSCVEPPGGSGAVLTTGGYRTLKRKRGRPPIYPVPVKENLNQKKKRGRPRKINTCSDEGSLVLLPPERKQQTRPGAEVVPGHHVHGSASVSDSDVALLMKQGHQPPPQHVIGDSDVADLNGINIIGHMTDCSSRLNFPSSARSDNNDQTHAPDKSLVVSDRNLNVSLPSLRMEQSENKDVENPQTNLYQVTNERKFIMLEKTRDRSLISFNDHSITFNETSSEDRLKETETRQKYKQDGEGIIKNHSYKEQSHDKTLSVSYTKQENREKIKKKDVSRHTGCIIFPEQISGSQIEVAQSKATIAEGFHKIPRKRGRPRKHPILLPGKTALQGAHIDHQKMVEKIDEAENSEVSYPVNKPWSQSRNKMLDVCLAHRSASMKPNSVKRKRGRPKKHLLEKSFISHQEGGTRHPCMLSCSNIKAVSLEDVPATHGDICQSVPKEVFDVISYLVTVIETKNSTEFPKDKSTRGINAAKKKRGRPRKHPKNAVLASISKTAKKQERDNLCLHAVALSGSTVDG